MSYPTAYVHNWPYLRYKFDSGAAVAVLSRNAYRPQVTISGDIFKIKYPSETLDNIVVPLNPNFTQNPFSKYQKEATSWLDGNVKASGKVLTVNPGTDLFDSVTPFFPAIYNGPSAGINNFVEDLRRTSKSRSRMVRVLPSRLSVGGAER